MDSLYFDTFEEDEPSDEPSTLDELGLSSLDGLDHLLCYQCKTKRPRRLCRRCQSTLLEAKRSGKLYKSALETAISPIQEPPCHGSVEASEPLHRLGLSRLQLSGSTQPDFSIHVETIQTFITNAFFDTLAVTQTQPPATNAFWDSSSWEPRRDRWWEEARLGSRPSPDWETAHESIWGTNLEISCETRWDPSWAQSFQPLPHPPPPPPPPYSESPPAPPTRICSNPYCLPVLHHLHLFPSSSSSFPLSSCSPLSSSSPPFPLAPLSCSHQTCLTIYRDRLRSLLLVEPSSLSSSSSIRRCPDPYYCYHEASWEEDLMGPDHHHHHHTLFAPLRELLPPANHIQEVVNVVVAVSSVHMSPPTSSSSSSSSRNIASTKETYDKRRRKTTTSIGKKTNGEERISLRAKQNEVGTSLLPLTIGRIMYPRPIWITVGRSSLGHYVWRWMVRWVVTIATWPWRAVVESLREVIRMLMGKNNLLGNEEQEDADYDDDKKDEEGVD